MTHGSLFSGIGGFDLAADLMGWENLFHCEWNEFGQKVLKYYWPNADSLTDITKTDFTKYANRIDILTGGFPCQPYSAAGKRKGKDDERHLWPEMLRAIREIRPRWVVGENVLGLVNWSGGLVFHEVQTDLEAEGYEVQAFVLPACSVNAPHRRDRVWFVAYRNGTGFQTPRSKQQTTRASRSGFQRVASDACIVGRNNGCDNRKERHVQNDIRTSEENKSERKGRINRISKISKTTTNANSKLPQGGGSKIEPKKAERYLGASFCHNDWQNFPTQSPVCDGNDGVSSRLDGITFPKWRNESIKAGGNAIVPQVALQIFKSIQDYESRI